MNTTTDVVIVGGSVAGAATALFLARRGRSVVVLDRARFPRDKPCGEGVMPHGVDVLAVLGVLDEAQAAGATALHGVRYILAGGATVAAPFPRTPGRSAVGLGVRRLALDALLVGRLHAQAGVEICEGFRVRDLLWRGGVPCGVTDGEREARARVVVGADGLRSRVRTALGWDASRRWPRRYAVVGHFRLSPEQNLAPEVEVVLAQGMEAYLTPLGGGEALVALLGGRPLMRRFAGDLTAGYAAAVRNQPRLAALLGGATLLPGVRATGPFAARAKRVAGPGALLVGDAAGFLDPITGEGIAAALVQARAAAAVIDRALADEGAIPDLSAYSAAHHRLTVTGNRLTWIALALCASPALSARAMRGLQHRDGLFSRLLAINCGHAGLGSITPRDWLALLPGR